MWGLHPSSTPHACLHVRGKTAMIGYPSIAHTQQRGALLFFSVHALVGSRTPFFSRIMLPRCVIVFFGKQHQAVCGIRGDIRGASPGFLCGLGLTAGNYP